MSIISAKFIQNVKIVVVFKVIDGELTNIFKKTQSVSGGFNLASNEINKFAERFNKINKSQNFGLRWDTLIDKTLSKDVNVATYFEELAKQGASARANIQGVYAAILDGNTRGIGNVKSVINMFNSLDPQNQKAFAAAVGQTNAELGNYLSNVQGSTASMKNYVGQLAATKAATIGLRIATIALNTALIAGISFLISKGIQAISEWHKSQEELRQEAEESAKAYDEQTKSLQDLRQQYIDIVDSEKSAKEKTEELNTWKQTLIDTYDLEKEAIEKVNTEREKGLELLDEEIEKQNRDSRGKWLGKNESQIEKAKEKINELYYGAESNGQISTSFFNKIDADEVRDSIKGLFNNVYELGAEDNWQFTVGGDNLIEKYENIQKIISELGNSKDLTSSEENLLKALNEESDEIKGILDEYQDIYEKYYEFTSLNNFEEYKKDNPIKDVGKDSYLAWKQGLLDTANGDNQLIKELTELVENQFPDYEQYFKNLEEAKKKFIAPRQVNSLSDMNLRKEFEEYIESLSDEDLSILIQLDDDAFNNGIAGVEQAIAKFKSDPNNKLDNVFDITNYQEDIETVYGNIDKLQSAIGKIDEGKFDFSGDIQDLVKAFPEYSEEILAASDDTDKLRDVLQRLLNSQPNDLIKSLQEVREQIITDKERKAVDNLINSLRNSTKAAASVYTLSNALDDVSNKQSLLSTVWKEMNTDGQISVSTYKSLTEAGDEYAGIVTNNNGVLTVSAEKVKELIKKNYELEIATDKNTVSQLRYNAAMAAAAKASQAEIDAINQRADLLIGEIKAKETALALFNSFDYTSDDTSSGSSSSSDDPWKDEAETKIKEIDHLYEMGEISEEERINRLDKINQKYYANNEKYLDDFNKYEEEIYKARKEQEQDLFDQRIENLEELADKSLDTNDFEGAREAVNTQKTEIQNRIIELQTSGKQDVEDEIKELNDKLKELDNTLNDISSEEYEFNISVKEDKIDDLDKEYELTGDTSVFDKKIEVYNGLISDANDEINRLLGLGYTMESDEIQNLLKEIDGYADEIADIWGDQTEVIKDNIDEQIKALDRDIETTGDTKLYSDKIKVYKDGQQKILDMIEFYRKQGYAEDSQIIKDLEAQWQDYQDSINDTLEEQVNAQVEAYSEFMDEQREMLEKQQKEQDDYYDKEIKALEDKKSALEEINEEIEKENELEEKRQSIAEAERNLYKNVRLVYAGNGQWVQKAREEDLEAVENAEKELSDTLRQQEIKAIEDQINAINEAKTAYDETIEKQITAIDESEKSFEKAMEDSIKVRKQLDYELIASIVGTDKANEYKLNAEKITVDVKSDKSDETDNSAIVDSNNAIVESNEKLAESNNKLGENKADTSENSEQGAVKSTPPVNVMQMMYNMFKGNGVFNKDISFDKFQNNAQNLLNSSLKSTPNITDDIANKKNVVNFTMNNSHTITQNITVNGAEKSGEELANQIAETCESKITQAFIAYGNEYRNTLNKMLYSNK